DVEIVERQGACALDLQFFGEALAHGSLVDGTGIACTGNARGIDSARYSYAPPQRVIRRYGHIQGAEIRIAHVRRVGVKQFVDDDKGPTPVCFGLAHRLRSCAAAPGEAFADAAPFAPDEAGLPGAANVSWTSRLYVMQLLAVLDLCNRPVLRPAEVRRRAAQRNRVLEFEIITVLYLVDAVAQGTVTGGDKSLHTPGYVRFYDTARFLVYGRVQQFIIGFFVG